MISQTAAREHFAFDVVDECGAFLAVGLILAQAVAR